LPFVYTGLCKDFWNTFEQYLQLEKDIPTTYFIIPFKNKPGQNVSRKKALRRATKYEITEIKEIVNKLLKHGYEIGVHGIDSWHNIDLAKQEKNRIMTMTGGQKHVGIRMHWLCFNQDSFKILDHAGFLYDSTFGYNNAVGYKGGTLQVFRPMGVDALLELPLHIQDNALFSTKRMNLSITDPLDIMNSFIQNNLLYGGVLTLLWHPRSIAPERLYKDFYIKILEILKNNKMWFGTAVQVVEWFKKRRNISFECIHNKNNSINITIKGNDGAIQPSLIIRIYNQKLSIDHKMSKQNRLKGYFDVPLLDKNEINISW
jgi:peptidoglycan/xylan/chitin deacetylase (PgdA/CDA1 family)